jgi:mannose-6-phosphate isomerase-like protein (cupin superfamily)
MTKTPPPARIAIGEARQAPNSPGRLSALLLKHGSMELRWYAPRGEDAQTPHNQDEIYIVAAGTGTFLRAGERFRFGPGDALFVAAGVEHRFVDFSEDFAVWVVFYGPAGGEAQG